MSDDKKTYRIITEEELKKYLRGELSPVQSHDLERRALDHDFEGDALTGWGQFEVDELSEDLHDLRNRLKSKKERRGFYWMKVAAVGLLILVAGYGAWQLAEVSVEQDSIAQKMEQEDDAFHAPDVIDEDAEVVNEEPPPMEEAVPEHEPKIQEGSNSETKVSKPVAKKKPVSDVENDLMKEELVIPEQEEMTFAEADIEEVESFSPKMEETMVASEGQQISKMPSEALQGRMAGVAVSRSTAPVANASFSDSADKKVRYIRGVVFDKESKEPLPGVNVLAEGTSRGAISDLDGAFELNVSDSINYLSFSFVGYQEEVADVSEVDTVSIALDMDLEALQEVVVVGYGVQEKRNITGSVAIVDEAPAETYQSAQPVGGMQVLKDYIRDHKVYPDSALKNEISGTVKLKVTISSSGEIANIEIKKSLGYGCDQEAIRLIEEGPEWESAERGGNTFESDVIVRVKFP